MKRAYENGLELSFCIEIHPRDLALRGLQDTLQPNGPILPRKGIKILRRPARDLLHHIIHPIFQSTGTRRLNARKESGIPVRQATAHHALKSFVLGEFHMNHLAAQTGAEFRRHLQRNATVSEDSHSNRPDQKARAYLVVAQQLRAQDRMFGVMGLLVRERAERNGSDVVGADEGHLAVAAGRVDLALVFDREAVLFLLREVLYRVPPLASASCTTSHTRTIACCSKTQTHP